MRNASWGILVALVPCFASAQDGGIRPSRDFTRPGAISPKSLRLIPLTEKQAMSHQNWVKIMGRAKSEPGVLFMALAHLQRGGWGVKEPDRRLIVDRLFQLTKSDDSKLKKRAAQCLVQYAGPRDSGRLARGARDPDLWLTFIIALKNLGTEDGVARAKVVAAHPPRGCHRESIPSNDPVEAPQVDDPVEAPPKPTP